MMALLETMQSRIGIAELPSEKADNPIILGWFAAIGHPEIKHDEVSWCATTLGSALTECGLPTPPINVNMMARSYESYGVSVAKDAIKPGDIAIWPRPPVAWQGHVNVVEKVVGKTVVCIGGNQSTGKGADAVTRAKPRLISDAVCFRRPVEPTIPALRAAGSSEVKKGDLVQNAGIIATIGSSILASIKSAFGPVEVPQFATLPEGLSWWQTILGGANAIGKLFLDHPWLFGTIFGGLICIMVGRSLKAARLAKHKAGLPLSSQVA